MATNVAVDSILDGIVGKLTTTLVPTAGNPVTTARPVGRPPPPRQCCTSTSKAWRKRAAQSRRDSGA